MATIVGVRTSSLRGARGETVTGKNIFFTEPLSDGEGVSAKRVFLTTEKLLKCQYGPKVGDDVRIEYERTIPLSPDDLNL